MEQRHMDPNVPIPDATTPVPSAVPSDTPDQPLGLGTPQTPDPTVQAGQTPDTPGTHAPGTPEQPSISREEYEAIQRQLQEKESILSQIQQVAEQQKRAAEEQQYRTQLRGRLEQKLGDAIENGDRERAVEVAYELMNEEITGVTGKYQQQMESYHQEVEQAFRAATLPGYADHLIREHQLPADLKGDLLQFQNERDMTNYALRVKATVQHLHSTMQQQAIQQQATERKNAGVYAMGGVSSGPLPDRPLEPGTARELMPVLRDIFGS